MISTIYYGESDIVVFWHIKLNSTAEKTHPRVAASSSPGLFPFFEGKALHGDEVGVAADQQT